MFINKIKSITESKAMTDFENLMQLAVDSTKFYIQRIYTSPRTYGVYAVINRLNHHQSNHGKKFRFGNHPIRQHELIKQYGTAEIQAVFLERHQAKIFADRLNQYGSNPLKAEVLKNEV
jgi:hypothetical protein